MDRLNCDPRNFIQGTTPTHIFRLSIETEKIEKLRLTYRQLGRTVLEKTEEDVEVLAERIEYTLSQEESLQFGAGVNVEIQLKVITKSGTVMASQIFQLPVSRILNTEVL